MTNNFDPERWYENEYSAIEVLHKKGKLTDLDFDKARSDLLNRYEEMISRSRRNDGISGSINRDSCHNSFHHLFSLNRYYKC
ncbi:hypothetical protein D1BOALGB6SA_2352 [Olavius sp. associated proteobacterium Delta 1]|nr:hypothetical protein D1BOALGB6SA_2352 [Olavius sp. associated proteobacterium Delta 1]